MKKIVFLLPILCFCSLVSCNKEAEQNNEESSIPDDPNKPLSQESEIFKRAMEELGKPYAWGAVGPDSYDASGFVSYCLTGQHIRLGTCNTFMGYPVADDPVPGNICVNQNNCGIYAGNNQMIFAPGPGQVVKYGSIESTMIIVKYS